MRFFDLKDVDFGFELGEQAVDTLANTFHFQHFLLLLKLQRQMSGDGVGQATGILDAGDGGQHFRRNLLVQFDELVKLGNHGAAHRLDFVIFNTRLNERNGSGHEDRGLHLDGFDAGALRPFDQHLDGAVRQLEHLQDVGQATYAIKIFRFRLILGSRLLGDQQDVLAGFHGHFERLDGFGAADEQRDDHVRENDDVAQAAAAAVRRFPGACWGSTLRCL